MREAFISILALLAVSLPTAKCTDVGKDGFNFYKDYLRARSDDDGTVEGPVPGERMLYFYRTPLQLYPGLLPAIEQEYRKRTGNAYKNHMLSKELWSDGETSGKRSSKTALSLMMGKQPYYSSDTPVGDDNGEIALPRYLSR